MAKHLKFIPLDTIFEKALKGGEYGYILLGIERLSEQKVKNHYFMTKGGVIVSLSFLKLAERMQRVSILKHLAREVVKCRRIDPVLFSLCRDDAVRFSQEDPVLMKVWYEAFIDLLIDDTAQRAEIFRLNAGGEFAGTEDEFANILDDVCFLLVISKIRSPEPPLKFLKRMLSNGLRRDLRGENGAFKNSLLAIGINDADDLLEQLWFSLEVS